MEKEWFDSWFDSSYYSLLYAHRDYKEAEQFVARLVDHLKPTEGSSVLDLACGRGRHSLYLHKKGLKVTGVDLSKASIKDALQVREGAPPLGPEFLVKDMRVPFGLGQFDLILNLFTSFGYFSSMAENEQVFANVRASLAPDGIFVLDFMNAQKAIRDLVGSEHKSLAGNIDAEITRRVENGKIIKEITIHDEGKSYHYMERVQALLLEDFQHLTRKSGFTITQLWGDYQGNKFDELNSPRLILFLRVDL